MTSAGPPGGRSASVEGGGPAPLETAMPGRVRDGQPDQSGSVKTVSTPPSWV
jgi:hypothetical protein